MTLHSDWSQQPCSIARGIDAVGEPYTLPIILEPIAGVRRFDEIHTWVDASDKILANRLRQLVEGGLATLIPYENASPGKEQEEMPMGGFISPRTMLFAR